MKKHLQAYEEFRKKKINFDSLPVEITSWLRNWKKLTTYFAYPEAIRKLIYTTNTIEGYHRQIRKITKTKRCHYF